MRIEHGLFFVGFSDFLIPSICKAQNIVLWIEFRKFKVAAEGLKFLNFLSFYLRQKRSVYKGKLCKKYQKDTEFQIFKGHVMTQRKKFPT